MYKIMDIFFIKVKFIINIIKQIYINISNNNNNNDNDYNYNLVKLKKLSWSGIPEECRPEAWQILMVYINYLIY